MKRGFVGLWEMRRRSLFGSVALHSAEFGKGRTKMYVCMVSLLRTGRLAGPGHHDSVQSSVQYVRMLWRCLASMSKLESPNRQSSIAVRIHNHTRTSRSQVPIQPPPHLHTFLHHRVKPLPHLPQQHMPHPLKPLKPNSLPQLPPQHLRMMKADHPIRRPMHHANPPPPHLIPQLPQLLLALMMPARRHRLQNEPFPREPDFIHAFPQLLGGEAVAVGREPAIRVWCVEEFAGEEACLDLGELGVDLLRDEQVDALAEVLDEADGVFEAGGRADEGETADAVGDQEAEFLRDHAAHADAYEVELARLGPVEGVEEVEGVAGHFGGGVAEGGFGGGAHAAVVEDQALVFAAVGGGGVGEVVSLPLPGGFEGAEAHYPLDRLESMRGDSGCGLDGEWGELDGR